MATAQPAAGLLRSFERSDAALALVASKLETEADQTFQGVNSRLNPARLLKRLQAIEAELPRLKEAAAKNAAARSALGALHAAQCANQANTLALARRAHAPIDADAAAFDQAEAEASAGLSRFGLSSGGDVSCASAPAEAGDLAPPSLAPPPPTQPHTADEHDQLAAAPASGAPPLSAVTPLIGELQWLRLGSSVREGVSLTELNEFWTLLRSLYMRRETRSLQAAQLLALGVRMSEENARRMRTLQALGLIKLATNEVHLLADPA